jgi:hypothetical protein
LAKKPQTRGLLPAGSTRRVPLEYRREARQALHKWQLKWETDLQRLLEDQFDGQYILTVASAQKELLALRNRAGRKSEEAKALREYVFPLELEREKGLFELVSRVRKAEQVLWQGDSKRRAPPKPVLPLPRMTHFATRIMSPSLALQPELESHGDPRFMRPALSGLAAPEGMVFGQDKNAALPANFSVYRVLNHVQLTTPVADHEDADDVLPVDDETPVEGEADAPSAVVGHAASGSDVESDPEDEDEDLECLYVYDSDGEEVGEVLDSRT